MNPTTEFRTWIKDKLGDPPPPPPGEFDAIMKRLQRSSESKSRTPTLGQLWVSGFVAAAFAAAVIVLVRPSLPYSSFSSSEIGSPHEDSMQPLLKLAETIARRHG